MQKFLLCIPALVEKKENANGLRIPMILVTERALECF